MSSKESEVLKSLGISFVQVADYIGVTRQSVARGVEGDAAYIDGQRASTIFARLQEQQSLDLAERFKSACITELGVDAESFDEVPTTSSRDSIVENRGPSFNEEEIWVFTARPREIYMRGYLTSIAERVYRKTEFSNVRRMIFFVPEEVCRTLTEAISEALTQIDENDRIWVQVVECAAARLTPHYIILNPRQDNAQGQVAAIMEDRFQRIPQNILDYILDNIIKFGFNILGSGPDKSKDMDMMSVYFDSQSDMG